MEFRVGQIVRAKAGRDKDGFFIITKLDGSYAYIADGKSRRVAQPKKKKLIHLAPTNTAVHNIGTDREVKRILSEFLNESDN